MAGFAQGLLSALQPWMTGSSPSALNNSFAQYGGTAGLMDALLQSGGPDTTQAREGAALERARALALQQAGQRQQLAQGAMRLPLLQAYYGAATDSQGMPSGAPSSALSPWMTGANPSALDTANQQYGGTSGLTAAMLQSGMPQSNQFGAALERAQTNSLANAASRQQLSQGAMRLPIIQQYYGAASGSQVPAGLPNGAPSGQGGPQVASGGIAPPSAGFSITSRPPSASPFTVPTPEQIASMPVGGMSPQMLRLGALLSGQNPLAAAQQLRTQQLALAQQQYGPVLAQLDTLNKAQSPAQYVKANPQLMATWNQIAPTLGFDPAQGFTDPNVRTAFSFLRNRIAGALTLPTVAPPVQMSTVGGPLGSMFSRNPITGAISQVKPEEQLKAVVGPNGTVSYVPASQATGRTPFNDQTYANPTTTSGLARMIANYEVPPLSGFALRSAQGQAIMAAVKQFNPDYDATAYNTKNTARMKFAVGKQGDIVRSLSVATSHLDQLSEAAQALSQHDFPTFNRIANAIGVHVTGGSAQTDFDSMREIVGDEVIKAVVGTSGAEGDRQAIKDAFDSARSPAQIQGVIDKYEGLMSGQLSGLRRQYQKATGLNDFNSFVSNLAQRQLSTAPGSAPRALNVGQSSTVGQFTVTRVK